MTKKGGTLNAFLSESGKFFANVRGRNEGGTNPLAPIYYGRAEWLPRASKSPENVARSFFNTVNLLQKELRFEHGGCQTCLLSWAPS